MVTTSPRWVAADFLRNCKMARAVLFRFLGGFPIFKKVLHVLAWLDSINHSANSIQRLHGSPLDIIEAFLDVRAR